MKRGVNDVRRVLAASKANRQGNHSASTLRSSHPSLVFRSSQALTSYNCALYLSLSLLDLDFQGLGIAFFEAILFLSPFPSASVAEVLDYEYDRLGEACDSQEHYGRVSDYSSMDDIEAISARLNDLRAN